MLTELEELLVSQIHQGINLFSRSLEIFDRKCVNSHAVYAKTETTLQHLKEKEIQHCR